MPWWAWTVFALTYGAVWRLAFRWFWEAQLEKTWDNFWGCVACAAVLFWVLAIVVVCEGITARATPDRVARLIGGESRAAKRRRQKHELAERELGIAAPDILEDDDYD